MRSGSLWLLGPPNSSYLIPPPPFCLERSRVPPFGGGASNHFIETSYPFCSLLFFGSSTFLSCFLFPLPPLLLRETLPDHHTRPPSQKLNGCCFGCCCCWKNWTIHSLPVLEQQQIFQKKIFPPPSFLPVRLEAPSVAAASGPCGDKHPDVGIAVFLVYFQKLFAGPFIGFTHFTFFLLSRRLEIGSHRKFHLWFSYGFPMNRHQGGEQEGLPAENGSFSAITLAHWRKITLLHKLPRLQALFGKTLAIQSNI